MALSNRPCLLVTGGARRLGAEICLSGAKKGWSIALHYHKSETQAKELQEIIMREGGNCELFPQDLSLPLGGKSLMESVLKRMGTLQALVHGASGYFQGSWRETVSSDFHKELQLQSLSFLEMIQLMAPSAPEGSWATALVDGRRKAPPGKYFVYQSTKRLLGDLVGILARETGPRLRINALALGLILPDEEDPGDWEKWASSLPLAKGGSVGMVLQALWNLAHQEYTTGQILYVDGGRHLKESPYA